MGNLKMVEFKAVINDPKSGKSYQKIITDSTIVGKKIKDRIIGDSLNLKGYELELTGGSDSSGFPMRKDFDSSARKRIILTKGPGLRHNKKGRRIRKTLRGNTIGVKITQVNLKILKYGDKKPEEIFKKEEVKEEKK